MFYLVVRVWGGQCREKLILNVAVFVLKKWGCEYREELILNGTVFVVGRLGCAIKGGTDTELYCVDCDAQG